MIKHYFCEYCGKDFLSEDECAKHEMECEVKIKKESEEKKEKEKQADLEEIVDCFNEIVDLCTAYIEKYKILDINKFMNTIRNKLSLKDKNFGSNEFTIKSCKPLSIFGPWEFTIEDVKYSDEDLNKMLGVDNLHPAGSEVVSIAKDKDKDKDRKNKEDELDSIINKLSNSPEVKSDDVTMTDITIDDFRRFMGELFSCFR